MVLLVVQSTVAFQNIITKSLVKFDKDLQRSIIHIHRSGNKATDILARMEFASTNFIEFI